MIALAVVLVGIVILYKYATRNFKYWEKKGVKHDKPIPFFGNNAKNFFMRRSLTQLIGEIYSRYPGERVVGYYRASRPELIIRDPEIAKKILISEFAYFHSREIFQQKDIKEPLLKNLVFLEGDSWRLLRQRLTPAFSSGKLKAMFSLIVERVERLQERLESAAKTGTVIDSLDLMARYTTDVIGACGFGLDSDSLQDENSVLRKLCVNILNVGYKEMVVMTLKDLFPHFFKYLKTTARIEKDILGLVGAVQKERNYHPSGRNDFIDLLLECKKQGTIVGESMERKKSDGSPEIATLEMDDDLIAAQAFVFFAAGFETASSASSYTLHELAYSVEVQEKVHDEIDKVLVKYNNKISYDAIKELTYLEWTFKEAMRIFPSLGLLKRQCTRKYTFQEIGLTIDRGIGIIIPLQAFQNDPKYFEDPTEFRPKRFDPILFDSKKKLAYLPFGGGPRSCIGK